MTQKNYDAVIIGAGPNGLAAAIRFAQEGHSVLVLEAADTPGGGCRSAELTLPGFTHDICSAIHPLGYGSPFFRTLPLENYGLEWIQPDAALAHPFDDGPPALLKRSVEDTAATLGADGENYKRLIAPIVPNWDETVLALREPLRLARYPLGLARFGLKAMLSSQQLTEQAFQGGRARGFFSGLAAHSMLPLEQSPSAAFGLALGITGHAVGWPFPRGGSQKITDALIAHLKSLGGEVTTGQPVASLKELPSSRVILADITPRQLVQIAGEKLPDDYRTRLNRYRYGMGAFKMDWALDGPIPWKSPETARAGTVHLGGSRAEISLSERTAAHGEIAEQPYILLAQQSLFDPTRAPHGQHTVWAYCHVPNGCTVDMTGRIEAQIERFAPGFRDRILARHIMAPRDMEQYNANYIGGDINGGIQDWAQLFTRPLARWTPWSTPVSGLYLCSSSTPPGGGVHGMCGYYAAMAALSWLKRSSPV
jgi:phytoene dehydrogenase-like protein